MKKIEACDYAGRFTIRYQDTHKEIDSIEEIEEIAEIVNNAEAQQQEIERLKEQIVMLNVGKYGIKYYICLEGRRLAEVERLRAMLERMEWAGFTQSNQKYCVICGCKEDEGHDTDCELWNLIEGDNER